MTPDRAGGAVTNALPDSCRALENLRVQGIALIARLVTFNERGQLLSRLDIQLDEGPVQVTFNGPQ